MTVTLETINFQDYELKCRCGCEKLNYDDLFLMKLEVFRGLLGSRLKVTSGCRCLKHNKAIGGRENSCHICENRKATAVDVCPFDTDCRNVFILALKTGLFNEVIWYKSRNFIHLAIDKNQKEQYYEVI